MRTLALLCLAALLPAQPMEKKINAATAKFKGKADAESTLVAQLKAGKGHPAVKASDADITTMVKFVLAQ
jgi:cytochrome c551/c552